MCGRWRGEREIFQEFVKLGGNSTTDIRERRNGHWDIAGMFTMCTYLPENGGAEHILGGLVDGEKGG